MQSSTCQHGPTLQFVSCAEKDSLSGTVMMAFDMFGSMPQCLSPWHAPSKVGAKELSYNSLNLIHEFTSLFSPKVTVAGLPRKKLPPQELQECPGLQVQLALLLFAYN